MKSCLRMLATTFVTLFFVIAGAPWLHAQITNQIRAHIDHSFVVGNATLPPGDYIFRMMQDSELSIMTASSANDKIRVEFLVRDTTDDHTPRHSELTFRKYGNTEFLNRIFEMGSKDGAEVTETSRQEARFVKQHKHAIEHTEEQK